MHPTQIHLVATLCLLLPLLAVACFLPDSKRRLNILFDLLVMLAVVVGRWPVLVAGRLGNPDEAQKIAGAATLWERPEFWKWVDGPTAGPLSFYSLWLGKLAGLEFGFLSARLVAAVFFAGSVVALSRFIRNRFSDVSSRVAAVPFVVFGSLVLFWDMVQYGNETTPLFLLCVGMALAFPAKDDPGPHYLRLAAAGLALGAVPFAKLQVAPMAFFVGITAVVAVILRADKPGKWGRVIALVGGALVVSSIAAVYLTIYNLWHHFFTSYIYNNIAYVQSGDSSTMQLVRRFLPYLQNSQGVLHLFLGSLAFLATCLWLIPSFSRSAKRWICWSLAWLLLALAAILLPGRAFEHYQLLLIPPLMVFCGCLLGGMFSMEKPPAAKWAMIAVFLLATTVPLASVRIATHRRSWAHLDFGPYELKPVVEHIRKFAGPGETMAIWGWQPDLWVNTGLIQATRDGNTWRQHHPGPQREYYRGRYLFDIRRNMPPLFLDATGPGRFAFDHRGRHGHETWPDLAEFVAENYSLNADIATIRIYVRNDLAGGEQAPVDE